MTVPRSLVLLALLGSCTIHVHETSVWHRRTHWGVTDHTATETVVLQCPADVDVAAVELQLRCRAGTVEIELTDPAGVVRYRETLRDGDRENELRFDAREGEWRCRFEFSQFSGDYHVELRANDDSRQARITFEPTPPEKS